ncbi:MAG: S9 family peptidase [Caldilineaceae bacterium]|nr:S9 family peptidase [Caldilineaceae bacterium]
MPIDFARYLNIRSATMPALAPDGRRIAFLTDITGNNQVWSVSIADGAEPAWPRQLTFFADKVWELYATAAADHLIAVSDVGGNERQQLYLITGFGGDGHDVRRLTPDDEAIHRFGAFSRDGRQIVYTSNARSSRDFDPWIMDIVTGERRMLAEMRGNRMIAAWSPDGDQLLMVDVAATEQIELSVLDVATGVERRLLGEKGHARYAAFNWKERGIYLLTDLEWDAGALCRLDAASGELTEIVAAHDLPAGHDAACELELLAVRDDGEEATLALNVEGYSHLYRVNLADGGITPVAYAPDGVIADPAYGGRDTLIFSRQNAANPSDIWLCDLRAESARPVTASNRAGIGSDTFVVPDLIHFPTHDGRRIPAFYYTPQSAPPAGGYPCILYVHGGPAGQQRPDFDVRFQYFLQRGYALLVTNVRGSTGYGRAYMMLDDVEKRMESVADLQHAVFWLHARQEINNARIAVYGRSYGGFMVLAALTEYPELFSAGIDVVGIANWVTFLERTSDWRRAHREREYGSLANHRALLERISPIHKAERIDMPLLVIAGDNDPRVPLYESEQVVERVRAAGGTVEFLHYADEGHKISKLANRIDSFTRMAEFLDGTIGEEKRG